MKRTLRSSAHPTRRFRCRPSYRKEQLLANSGFERTTNRIPEPVARIAEVMSTFRPTWALCGGWAVDAWAGRLTRDHGDTDIIIFHNDLRAFFDHLSGWQLIAHDTQVADDTAELWNGRPLVLPAHIHARSPEALGPLSDRLDAAAQQGFWLDVQLNERSGDDWILSREPRISVPLTRCAQQSAWGVPVVAPEVLLFYKARELHPHDELDFLALLPHLTDEQRRWLRNARSLVGHPWLTQLS
jgi:hypothetical protein